MAKKFPYCFDPDPNKIKWGDYRRAIQGDPNAMTNVIASCAIDDLGNPADKKEVIRVLDEEYSLGEIQNIVEQLTESLIPKASWTRLLVGEKGIANLPRIGLRILKPRRP